MTTFKDIKEMLNMIKEDGDAPKNLGEKIKKMIELIDSNKEDQLKINTLQQELENIADDINLPTFIRTQIWSVSSALETVK